MSFSNATSFAALDVPMPDHEGRPVVVAIVKATFTVLPSGRLVPADKQRPVRINDDLYDPDRPESSIRLPTDVCVAKRKRDLVGKPAPQIEHPARPHRTADDDHPPVGLGAIRSHWSPRLERAGTFDEVWEKTRMPAMPADFDVRANNQAHPSLLFD